MIITILLWLGPAVIAYKILGFIKYCLIDVPYWKKIGKDDWSDD